MRVEIAFPPAETRVAVLRPPARREQDKRQQQTPAGRMTRRAAAVETPIQDRPGKPPVLPEVADLRRGFRLIGHAGHTDTNIPVRACISTP